MTLSLDPLRQRVSLGAPVTDRCTNPASGLGPIEIMKRSHLRLRVSKRMFAHSKQCGDNDGKQTVRVHGKPQWKRMSEV